MVSENTLLYDTALVTYIVNNEDKSPHTVGLRSCSTPTSAPTTACRSTCRTTAIRPSRPFLLTTMQDFPQKDIPDYIMAVENGDLTRRQQHHRRHGPAAQGHRSCRKRWSICRWPQNSEAKWGGTGRLGDWKYEPMDANPKVKDSCVVCTGASCR